MTIVSTSLVSITDNLHGFGRSSWIVAAYLLTYTGMMPKFDIGSLPDRTTCSSYGSGGKTE